LPELFDEAAGEPLQIEMSAVRILFKLLGFLLNPFVSIHHPFTCLRKIQWETDKRQRDF
jgi:hypothetical protein